MPPRVNASRSLSKGHVGTLFDVGGLLGECTLSTNVSAVPLHREDVISELTRPSSYSGLYNLHKYWGKKPAEPLRFLIKQLTRPNDLVVDPFVGSGAIARETIQAERKFIGSDVNPTAIRITRFLLQPCAPEQYMQAFSALKTAAQHLIDESYLCEDGAVASHLLWDGDEIKSVWIREGKRKRKERTPTLADRAAADAWNGYSVTQLRPLSLFDNSRINSKAEIGWDTLFTKRALRNIELLVGLIRELDSPLRNAFELTLTSAIGQMSQMVFAITGRGKTTGEKSARVEVGSWVIGYWRPSVRFELNVWNCFETRAEKMLKALSDTGDLSRASISSPESVLAGQGVAAVQHCHANRLLRSLPDSSVQLLITDPPHGDRIPYLELSEMWNAVLGETSPFEEEIVVSNARARDKTVRQYSAALDEMFTLATDKLREGGVLALMFNSRRADDWKAIRRLSTGGVLNLIGRFPLTYSATSVVQDNRDGSMKTDYILLFSKGDSSHHKETLSACDIPEWSTELPPAGDMEA